MRRTLLFGLLAEPPPNVIADHDSPAPVYEQVHVPHAFGGTMSRASRPGHPGPTAVIVIAPDERTAEIVIEGRRQVVSGQAPKDTRRAALDVATGHAARIGGPVLIDARDANGYWRLVATPDGVVRAADPPPPGPAPNTTPPVPEKAGGGRKRVFVIVGAVVLALALIGGVGAVVLRFLPDSTTTASEAGEDEPTSDGPILDHPAPPGYATTVEITEELAPDTLPGVSGDGENLVYIDPAERLNLLNADGSREWSVNLPFEAAEVLGSPRFVEYDGAPHVAIETAGALWFWPATGGNAGNIELREAASAQYAGSGVLVRGDDSAYVPIDGGLEEIDTPGGSGAMLAEDGRALAGVLRGPWHWVAPDEDPRKVEPEEPEGAGDLDSIMTFIRGYAIVLWEMEEGDDLLLAFHDNTDGSVLGTAEVDPDDLEDVRHRTGPLGSELAAYGPVLFEPGSGETTVIPGFEPEIAIGERIFGELDGTRVAVDASGETVEVPEDAEMPRGLLGDRAVVVREDHLYAIPPE
ncbi:hypothetical protein ABZ645_23650 [Nocardiopsis alba]|uniref:hypothetical protein n=1 Tax=Nocardiopsis alba TaxID=53437 RepID=UPI0033D88355